MIEEHAAQLVDEILEMPDLEFIRQRRSRFVDWISALMRSVVAEEARAKDEQAIKNV